MQHFVSSTCMTTSSVFTSNEQSPVSTNYGKSKIRQIKPRQSPARNLRSANIASFYNLRRPNTTFDSSRNVMILIAQLVDLCIPMILPQRTTSIKTTTFISISTAISLRYKLIKVTSLIKSLLPCFNLAVVFLVINGIVYLPKRKKFGINFRKKQKQLFWKLVNPISTPDLPTPDFPMFTT